MKITFTHHALSMLAERQIEAEWVIRAIEGPESVEPDPLRPKAFRAFRAMPERGGRVLRVVYVREDEDHRVITAFFDRSRRK